jgi:hypothetical protein
VTADERSLLELLAESLNGATDALLIARGFKFDMMISLVRSGLAMALPERTFAADKPVDRTRVEICVADHYMSIGKGGIDASFSSCAGNPVAVKVGQ